MATGKSSKSAHISPLTNPAPEPVPSLLSLSSTYLSHATNIIVTTGPILGGLSACLPLGLEVLFLYPVPCLVAMKMLLPQSSYQLLARQPSHLHLETLSQASAPPFLEKHCYQSQEKLNQDQGSCIFHLYPVFIKCLL